MKSVIVCMKEMSKNNLEQNITLFTSIAHGFFNIITAELVKDLKDSNARRPLPPVKFSHQLSTIIENPLDESSDNSDDQTNTSYKPSGIISPPPFYTKRPTRIPKMTRFELFPKRKSSFNQPTNNDNTTDKTSSLQIST